MSVGSGAGAGAAVSVGAGAGTAALTAGAILAAGAGAVVVAVGVADPPQAARIKMARMASAATETLERWMSLMERAFRGGGVNV